MVYDCFTFFNELELLELRLNELNPVVDYFVLCEATYTHQGASKPLIFKENAHLFSAFLPKIIHIVSDQMPEGWQQNNWLLENKQRNDLAKGLSKIQPNDLIIVSDLDEIPAPEAIQSLLDTKLINVLALKNHYYYLNMRDFKQADSAKAFKYQMLGSLFKKYYKKWLVSLYWGGPVVVPASALQQYTLQDLRNLREDISKIDNLVPDGGWHFSYLGGIERIIQKLEAFAHTEVNTSTHKNKDEIRAKIAAGQSIHDTSAHLRVVPIDDTYPKYLLKHPERFNQLMYHA